MAFLSSEWLSAFFLPLLPVADNIHNSVASLTSVVKDPVDGRARNTTNKTAPHEQAASTGQWLCRDGCVRDFCEPRWGCVTSFCGL